LFQLPRLRNLYIDSNELTSLNLQALEKPIRAPLEYLNVAGCELQELPDLGILPSKQRYVDIWNLSNIEHFSSELWQLNASMNPLQNFRIDSLANMCHLQVIDLTKSQLSQCGCQQVTNHLMMLGASPKFVPVCLGK